MVAVSQAIPTRGSYGLDIRCDFGTRQIRRQVSPKLGRKYHARWCCATYSVIRKYAEFGLECRGVKRARVDDNRIPFYSRKVEVRLRILSLLLLLPSKSPFGWEVVQLVGLQTLDLAILVRVQASQPKPPFRFRGERPGPSGPLLTGFLLQYYTFLPLPICAQTFN